MNTVADTSRPISGRRPSAGFTLVEVLIVIVIIGILATVTVFAVRGITDRGEEASCQTDKRVLATAAEVYFAQNSTDTIPASGVGPNRFERALVDAKVLRAASPLHDLAADGTVSVAGTTCS